MARLSILLIMFALSMLPACLLDTPGLLATDADEETEEDACVATDEVCDGRDNDCDTAIDEDFDLQADVANCGQCGNLCTVRSNSLTVACVEGECRIALCESSVQACVTEFRDCDGRYDNGCEVCLNSDVACSDCGIRCTAEEHCVRGEHGFECQPLPDEPER